MAEKTMIAAITEAMKLEMERDPNVLVFGEDVGKNGGVFRATEGLQAQFGKERVFDTPLAESGIGGLAVGLGLQGYRPIMELQFLGFLFETMDAVVTQAGRMRYRSGGVYHAPMVMRSPFGGGVKTPELHADNLEGLLAQSPGLKVVVPSTPYDAKGLLLSAIRDNDPVVFLEHMKLYRTIKGEVPEGDYTIPIGVADVKREGTDVTVIAYGAMVHASLKAAEELHSQGISVEVVDLRTIQPLDMDTIVQSVWKTRRAVVVQEAQRQAGVAAQVVSEIQERALLRLEAPVLRVTSPDTIFPFALIEDEWIPNHADIIQKVKDVMTY